MPITTTDFPALTDDLQEIFNQVAKQKVSENVGFRVFNIMDTNRKTYNYLALHGLSGIQKVAEGADLPNITGVEGDTATWTQAHYGGLVPVTKDMRKFDLHNQIESLVKSVSGDAFDKVDQSLADVLIHGQDGDTYVDVYNETVGALCPDSMRLFDGEHDSPAGTTTFSNAITDGTNENPALSRDAIVYMRRVGLTSKDPNGLIRPIDFDTLLVPPALEDLALRIVNSERIPGSANNDINPVKGWIRNVVVWPRLQTAADATDASAYWFLYDSSKVKDVLKCLFAERPSLDAPEQVYKNKNWEYSIDYYYTIGRGYPYGIAGSEGDETVAP